MKKRIIIWTAIGIVLIGAITALRVSSWNRTFGLSQEVIEGTAEPSAEETIRLYFYYSNRRNRKAVGQILNQHCEDMLSGSWLDDLELLEMKDAGAWESPEEMGDVYQVWDYYVTYNQSILYAPKRETGNSESFRFVLVQEKKNGPWKIATIGHG